MFRKIILTVILTVTSLVASEINWAKDFKAGIQSATEQAKPVVFIFSRHSCKYCVILDETTFKDARVIEALNRDYVSIISYTDENDYTPQELWSPGTPTIWFLYPDGYPMFEPLQGAVDAESFLQAITIVKEEFDKAQEKMVEMKETNSSQEQTPKTEKEEDVSNEDIKSEEQPEKMTTRVMNWFKNLF